MGAEQFSPSGIPAPFVQYPAFWFATTDPVANSSFLDAALELSYKLDVDLEFVHPFTGDRIPHGLANLYYTGSGLLQSSGESEISIVGSLSGSQSVPIRSSQRGDSFSLPPAHPETGEIIYPSAPLFIDGSLVKLQFEAQLRAGSGYFAGTGGNFSINVEDITPNTSLSGGSTAYDGAMLKVDLEYHVFAPAAHVYPNIPLHKASAQDTVGTYSLYWMSDTGETLGHEPAFTGELDLPFRRFNLNGSERPYSVLNATAELDASQRPLNAAMLKVVFDEDNAIPDSSSFDNTAFIGLPPLDLAAESVRYMDKDTPATSDDTILLTYDVKTTGPIDVGLYWSSSSDFGGRKALAYRAVAEGDGTTEIPVAALNPRPNAPIETTHLVLHVDDIEGNLDGKVLASRGDDDSNNYKYLNILPDINPVASKWCVDGGVCDVDGGMDVQYKLVNPAFIDKKIMVQMTWAGAGSSRSAGPTFEVSREKREHHIEWEAFNVPQIGDEQLELKFDPSEQIDEQNDSDENNTVREGVGDWKPEVLFVVEAKDAFRKKEYDVSVTLKNRAPIAIDVDVYFEETIPTVANGGVVERFPLNRHSAPPFTQLLGFGEGNSSQVTYQLSALDGNGKFLRSWNWIPPEGFAEKAKELFEDYGQDALTELAEELAKKAGEEAIEEIIQKVAGAKDIFELIKTFADPQPLIPSVDIDYLLSAKALVGASGQSGDRTRTVTLEVPPERKEFLAAFQRAAGGAKVHNNLAVGLLIETGGLSAVLSISGLHLWQQAREFYRQALDPPSPDYKTLVELEVDESVLDRYSMESSSRAYALQRLVLAALTDAIGATEDRVLGALEAGDVVWESKQQEALSGFQHRAALEGLQQVGRASVMQPWFAGILGRFSAMVGDGAVPLPNSLRNELVALGASEEDLALFESTLATNNLRTPESAELLTWFEAHAAILNAIGSLRNLEGAVRLRTDSLGQSVLEVAGDKMSLLAATRQQIEVALQDRLPSEQTRQSIEAYLATARGLLLETNNIDELRDALQFGYAALINLQLMPPSISSLRGFVADQESKGMIAPGVATVLRDSLVQADAHLSAGEFGQASLALGQFASIATENVGSGVNQETAGKLRDFAGYLRSFTGAPIVISAVLTSNEDTAVGITLVARDEEDDPLTYSIVASPQHGSLSGTAPNLLYTPTADYFGSDTFTYKVNDGTLDSNVATVSITIAAVNDAPVAIPQSISGTQDLPINGTLSGNDGDPNVLQALTYALGSGPSHGTVSLNAATGAFTYIPAPSYSGPDSFTFTVRDDALAGLPDALVSNAGTVTISVASTGPTVTPSAEVKNGILKVVGTSAADIVGITRFLNQIVVAANFLSGGLRSFPATGIQSIEARLNAGNDLLVVAGDVGVPAILDGGEGDDVIYGGGGVSIILGGAGNDLLLGGRGRNVIVGGTGSDQLFGGDGGDLLIAGSTAYDSNDAALLKIMNEWTSTRSYNQRVANMRDGVGPVLSGTGIKLKKGTTVFDDSSADNLSGGSDLDWFFYDIQRDKTLGKKSSESKD